jgi:hypothetical protein
MLATEGSRMDSSKLKTWQARRMHDALSPALGYLSRLRSRMETVGFPPDDKLFGVSEAQSIMQQLVMELHYLSCKRGVGQPEREE